MSKSDSSSNRRKSKAVEPYLHDVDSDSKLRGLDDKDAAITHAHTQHLSTEEKRSSTRFKQTSKNFIEAVPHQEAQDGDFDSYVHTEAMLDDVALDVSKVHNASTALRNAEHVADATKLGTDAVHVADATKLGANAEYVADAADHEDGAAVHVVGDAEHVDGEAVHVVGDAEHVNGAAVHVEEAGAHVVRDGGHMVHSVRATDSKLIKDIEPEYIDADVIEDEEQRDLEDSRSSDDELAKLEEHFKSSFASEFTDTETIEPETVEQVSTDRRGIGHGEAASRHVTRATGTAIIRHPDNEASDKKDSVAKPKKGTVVTVAEHKDAKTATKSTTRSLSTKGQSLQSSAKHVGLAGKAAKQDEHGDVETDFDVFSQVKKFNAQHDGYDLDDSEHEEELDLESSSYGNFEDEEDNETESESDNFSSNESGMHVFEHDGHGSLDDEDDDDYSSDTPNLPVTHGDGHKKQSTALVKSSSSGGIGAFIKAANMVPMLSDEEEIELTRRFREEGDLSAARRLVESHLRLVIKEARGFTGYGLPLSDLIQEGNIGLMKAVKRFEPDKGARLSTFSRTYILSEIYEYIICNWRMVKVATTKAQRKILFNLNKFKNELRRFTASERQDVAATLGVSATDVAEMEKRLSGSDIGFDLDESDSSEKGVAVAMSPSAYLEDESSDFASTYEQSNYAAWELKKLREALNSLDDRSRYIIKRRWLDEDKATLQELSNEFKVSIERVRQIEANAMGKVKAILLNEGVSSEEYSDAQALEDKSSKRKSKRAVTTRRNQTARSASTQLKRHAAAGSGVKSLPHKKSAHTIKGEELNAKITGTALTEPLKKKRGRKKASVSNAETVRSGSSTISGTESTALLPAPKLSSRSD